MSEKKVLIAYASDYLSLSPGGIRTYIEVLAETKPDSIFIEFLGVSGPQKSRTVESKLFVGLELNRKIKKLNLAFLLKILRFDFSKYDLIMCHRAETALLIKFIHRKKVHLTLHGGTLNAFKAKKNFFGLIYPFVEILACIAVDETQAVNVETINPASVYLGCVSQAPLVVRTNIFYPAAQKGNEIFLVGRLEPEKRFDMALQFIADAERRSRRSYKINIVGDGSCREELQDRANALGLNTCFYGHVPNHELSDLLREKGKLLLLTSKFEGAPIVAYEAILAGLSVVALKNPGLEDNLAKYGVHVRETGEEIIDSIVGVMIGISGANHFQTELRTKIENDLTIFWNKVNSSFN
jgi:glycosyltransferase involved in cell wall biosynthesis